MPHQHLDSHVDLCLLTANGGMALRPGHAEFELQLV